MLMMFLYINWPTSRIFFYTLSCMYFEYSFMRWFYIVFWKKYWHLRCLNHEIFLANLHIVVLFTVIPIITEILRNSLKNCVCVFCMHVCSCGGSCSPMLCTCGGQRSTSSEAFLSCSPLLQQSLSLNQEPTMLTVLAGQWAPTISIFIHSPRYVVLGAHHRGQHSAQGRDMRFWVHTTLASIPHGAEVCVVLCAYHLGQHSA